MNRKKIAIVLLGIVFLASLPICAYFGIKAKRNNRLRSEAMAAYEKGDYVPAERLLLQYVQKNPDAEEEFVALANVYHEFGNPEMEAQMWQSASSLNPQNQEYYKKMLDNAVQSANYSLLHGILGRKAKVDDTFSDLELYLFVISSYRSGYPKDGTEAYKKYVEKDPEAFHKSDLGRMAEFMATYKEWSNGERDAFLNSAMYSEDPAIRFEALYFAIRRLEQADEDSKDGGEMERLLKLAKEANYYAGTALLASFYFSKSRFAEAIDVLDPYLKRIDDINLYLLYAESCVFSGNLDKLKALGDKLRKKSGISPFLADYCDVLAAYLENDEKRLAAAVRQYGKRIDSPLSRFIRLRVAVSNGSFNEIRTVAQEIFSHPPFHDLHNRALLVCLDYLSREMKKPENQKDPMQMADLAKILSGYLHENRLLTEIILMNQYKKGLVKEDYLLSALGHFPDDALLLCITAEYLVFNGKAEEALPIIEQVLQSEGSADRPPDRGVQILLMLALDQIGQHDEAAAVFRELALRSESDPELLGQYFLFCVNNRRTTDLTTMAEKLDAAEDGNLKQFGAFFRAAALLLTEDKSEEKEALALLAAAPADVPDFAFYAATCLYRHDMLDEAEAKYKAILKTYRTPSLPYVNLSNIYHAKGEDPKALEAAKTAFELEKESILPAFTYAKRLSEAGRYEEAVNTLKFPRHAVNYRKDIIELWRDCMYHTIEKSFAERKFLQAETQCKHLLIVVPDDKFGKDNLEKVRGILFPKD